MDILKCYYLRWQPEIQILQNKYKIIFNFVLNNPTEVTQEHKNLAKIRLPKFKLYLDFYFFIISLQA